MRLKDKFRLVAFKFMGPKNTDTLRYLKFSKKFKKGLKSKGRESFVKNFSDSYEAEMAIIPLLLGDRRGIKTVIIDIGANYGPYSFYLSKIYPDSKIFAFEPSQRSMDIFKKIIRKFSLRNVFPVKKGLGEKEETREILMPMQYTILAHVASKNQKIEKGDISEKIEITTLDNFLDRNRVTQVDFIKCDVEGFELEVFKGAEKTLKDKKPFVFVEVEERHTKKYGIKPQEVVSLFKKMGYSFYGVSGKRLIKTDSIIRDIPLYLFVPKDKKIPESFFF